MQKISNNVYVQIGVRGCNVTVAKTAEGLVMIDTPMVAEDAAKLKEEMAKIGQLRFIINTEPHMDHFAGNSFFDVPVIAHEGTRETVLSASLAQYQEMLSRGSNTPPDLGSYSFRAPSITLSQRLTLHLGGLTFKLAHMPGHSPFQVPVYIPEEKVLCTSDNVVHGSLAFLHQALPEAWLETLKLYGNMDAKVLVPGHGSICDKSYLPEMQAMIKTMVGAVQDAVKNGQGLEEVQNNLTLPVLFPGLAANPFMAQVLRMNLGRLYELYRKK
jgi:cyclase